MNPTEASAEVGMRSYLLVALCKHTRTPHALSCSLLSCRSGQSYVTHTPDKIAGLPLLNPATEDAADVTKALAGAADAANMWTALSLIVHN